MHPNELAKVRPGHFRDKCTADRHVCDDAVDARLEGGSFDLETCPKFKNEVVMKEAVGLCKQCQKDCAGKQT